MLRFLSLFLVGAAAINTPAGSLPAHVEKIRAQKDAGAKPVKATSTDAMPKPLLADDKAKPAAVAGAELSADAVADLVVAKLKAAEHDRSVKKAAITDPFTCPSSFTPTQTCCTAIIIDSNPQCGVDNPTTQLSNCQSDCDLCPQGITCGDSTGISTTTSGGGGNNPCFAKDSTTVCLLASPLAECQHILMADLVPGDLVLGRDGATTVIANQHKAVDTLAEMLTLYTADGEVSMTPDHAVFVDGELVEAADAKVGSSLSTGVITRITKREAAIINAVTADGTIVAGGVLAASNPYWIASLTVDAPLTRAVVNAAIYAAGDVDTMFAGCAKVATTLAVAALAATALRSRKASA